MEVELGVVVFVEVSVMVIFFFGEDVERSKELGVRFDGVGFVDNYVMVDIFMMDIMDKKIRIVISLSFFVGFFEGFDIGDFGFDGVDIFVNEFDIFIVF